MASPRHGPRVSVDRGNIISKRSFESPDVRLGYLQFVCLGVGGPNAEKSRGRHAGGMGA